MSNKSERDHGGFDQVYQYVSSHRRKFVETSIRNEHLKVFP